VIDRMVDFPASDWTKWLPGASLIGAGAILSSIRRRSGRDLREIVFI
jgi:hypothetical protein